MKAYLQNNKHPKHHTNNKNPSLTFRQLINKQHSHLIRVNCNNEVNVVMQKMMPINNEQMKRKDKRTSIIVGKNNYTLKSIFETYQSDNHQEYILAHKKCQISHKKYQSRGKSLSNKSSTSLKNYFSNKVIPQKCTTDAFVEEQRVQPKRRLHSFLSQKNIAKQQNMLKDYLQHENISGKQLKICTEFQPIKNQQILMKPNLKDCHRETSFNEKENTNVINQTFEKKSAQVQKIVQEDQQKSKGKLLNPRFSFGEIMKMGLVEQQSYKNKQSFKIAGDDQIQRLKQPKNVLPSNDMRSFEDLSSIISNVRDDTKKDLDVDSIKNQIQKINNCCIPKDRQYYNKLNNQKATKQNTMNGNKDENLMAPLKFRKKEEVVKHLVNAKIIFKESNSINIS